jgi:hypothetical protein
MHSLSKVSSASKQLVWIYSGPMEKSFIEPERESLRSAKPNIGCHLN